MIGDPGRRRARRQLLVGAALGIGAALVAAPPGSAQPRKPKPLPPLPKVATTSSPITLAPDGRTVWVVNPDANNVSVINTATNRVIRTLRTDREPRAIAIEPRGTLAFVANPEDNSVSVFRIDNPNPRRFRVVKLPDIVTGAEPWNVVASPDGKRVFVSNSGQDTVTVINVATRRIIGSVNLRASVCNDPDRSRHFQPRGLAVTGNSKLLYVTSFFAFTQPGGRMGTDTGRAGAVCQVRINTNATRISGYRAGRLVRLAPQDTGFTVDSTNDGVPDPTAAFPNQLQSIVIRGNQAYLPNIAASPTGPLRFNVDTHAFVSVLTGVNGNSPRDAGPGTFLNLHLGARNPEPGKPRVFFANVWAIGFARRGSTENAYVVSAGSDVLVKLNVNRGNGALAFTVDQDTTRYIDLNDPAAAAGAACRTGQGLVREGCAGKNPQGIAINARGTRAYVANYVSRNVSVVDLVNDRVLGTIRTQALPAVGSQDERTQVGAEVFFASRGRFDRPAGTTVSTNDRLSSEGWQSCASCHFEGLTDSVVWQFGTGPRKSVPLNATFNPQNRGEQRVLNYSAIFDEVEDFEANIRNVSGPGALAAAQACANPPPPPAAATSTLDPNHGLLFGDDGNINVAPCTLNAFALANAGRRQHTVTLPGSTAPVPALTAMREWVQLAVRTPNAPIPPAPGRPGPRISDVTQGRALFTSAGCASCHGGGKWTASTKTFTSPPAAADIATETVAAPTPGNDPIGAQYLPAFLRDIGSFNLGVPGGNNTFAANIGADEKASATLSVVNGNLTSAAPKDALGRDYNADGKGNGYNIPSLLGILSVPPYYHNGACESVACVVANPKHRTVNGTRPDGLVNPVDQAKVVAFLESIDGLTAPTP